MKMRILVLIMVLALLTSLLAGCGQPKTPDVAQTPNNPPVVTPPPVTPPPAPVTPPTPITPEPSDLSVGSWAYFSFKPGQFMKYNVTSTRGLTGWISVAVTETDKGELALLCEGNWGLGEFSETAILKPDMTGFDLAYSFEDVVATNALSSLLIIDGVPFEEVTWEEGFEWSSGDKSIKVTAIKEYAGVSGLVMTYTSKHWAKDTLETKTYCVNEKYPLPLSIECPAANDTWKYELVEVSGL